MYQDEWPLKVGLNLTSFMFFDFHVFLLGNTQRGKKYGSLFAPRALPMEFANLREIITKREKCRRWLRGSMKSTNFTILWHRESTPLLFQTASDAQKLQSTGPRIVLTAANAPTLPLCAEVVLICASIETYYIYIYIILHRHIYFAGRAAFFVYIFL